MRFQCKYIAPPRDQYFTDIFNCSQNNAFVVIINKSNIKLVIKYGTFSLVFLTLFLLKYQLIKIRWYFKRNKDRNTRENMPYLITHLIIAISVYKRKENATTRKNITKLIYLKNEKLGNIIIKKIVLRYKSIFIFDKQNFKRS